jgi:N-acetylmuramoyl-L-alanine amidase
VPDFYTANQAIEFGLLVTLVGREARGEIYDAMLGVAWSVRNRVTQPRYWGHDWLSVMAHPEAYSSIYPPTKDNDPNLRVYPDMTNAKWALVLEACENAYWGIGPDPTNGATHYYDRSMDDDPPTWATDPQSEHVRDIGDLHFFKSH